MDHPASTVAQHGPVIVWIVPLVAAALVAARWLARRIEVAGPYTAQARVRFERRTSLAFVVAALVAAVTYGARRGPSLDAESSFHDYLTSRYLPELGHHGLYAAALAADAETGLRYQGAAVRDLDTGALVPAARVLARAPTVRARFRPKRWVTFVADVKWFKHQLSVDRWSALLTESGDRGTPARAAVVGLATNALSVRSDAHRVALAALDPLLLLAMLACVGWAYGRDAAALVAVLAGTHYLVSGGHLVGAIPRADAAVCTVAAACCMRRQRYALAGALLGWAAVSRVFPLVFAAGPGALFASRLVTDRRVDRNLARFFTALAAVMLATLLVSMARNGVHAWSATIAPARTDSGVGLRTLFDARFVDGATRPLTATTTLRRALLAVARLALVAPALHGARYLRDHEALTFGFVCLFALAAPAHGDLLVLVAPMLFYLERPDVPQRALGASYVLLTGAAGYLLALCCTRFATTYGLTWALCLSVLHMLALATARAYALAKLPAHMRR